MNTVSDSQRFYLNSLLARESLNEDEQKEVIKISKSIFRGLSKVGGTMTVVDQKTALFLSDFFDKKMPNSFRKTIEIYEHKQFILTQRKFDTDNNVNCAIGNYGGFAECFLVSDQHVLSLIISNKVDELYDLAINHFIKVMGSDDISEIIMYMKNKDEQELFLHNEADNIADDIT